MPNPPPTYNDTIVQPFIKVYQNDATWPSNSHDNYGGTQTTKLFLRLGTAMRVSDIRTNNGLHISLCDENLKTQINSGVLLANGEREVGWFITCVDVTIGVTLEDGTDCPPTATSPENSVEAGSESVSTSKGWSASAGAMGEAPMGSIGYDASESNSVSHTYQDIKVHNVSDDKLHYLFELARTSNGSYDQVSDIVKPAEWGFTRFGLYQVDDEVKGDDMPLISQGWWPLPLNYKGLVYITIDIKVTGGAVNIYGSAFGGQSANQCWSDTLLTVRETIPHLLDFGL